MFVDHEPALRVEQSRLETDEGVRRLERWSSPIDSSSGSDRSPVFAVAASDIVRTRPCTSIPSSWAMPGTVVAQRTAPMSTTC